MSKEPGEMIDPAKLIIEELSRQLRAAYTYLKDALMYLKASPEGRSRINNLYSHVFAVEHAPHGR